MEDVTVDVLVVGAGGAGMTAALTASKQGLDTLLVEKSDYFGGNTARSGGGVWVPGNYALVAAGVDDTPERAKEYLQSIVGDEVPRVRRDTYIDRGPEMMDFVREHTPLRFAWVPEYADYHPEQPGGRAGGRSVEPVPLDGRVIGAELSRLHPAYSKAPANLVVTQANFRWLSLGLRTLRGPLTMLKVFFRRLVAIALRRKMYGMGNALTIGLRKGLQDAGVPVWYATELTDLVLDDGAVVGATLQRDGQPVTVRARRGVILCSGGFEFNLELRQKHQPAPINTEWSTGAPSNTGDGILAGISAGADTALMDDAWWGPTIPLPRGAWFCLAERNLPGSIMVNGAGRRFMNEALPYVEAVHEIYAGEASGVPHVPCWMVVDQRYRNRYLFAGLGPRQPFPGHWLKSGVVVRSATLEGLAEKIGVPVDNLTSTIDRFNGFARSGVDEDFHRGESAYDKYYSDPTVKPNPSLHVIDQGPFYAVKIVPGDLGTKGGLVTDEHARVLRPDGSVISGLYAAGNTSAAVMGHTYAGPGATIGPAMTFGYLAALDLAGVSTSSTLTMPIDPAKAVGAALPDRSFAWTASDVLLYHLGVGFGSRSGDNLDRDALSYTFDGPDLQVLPSFGIVAPTFHDTDPPSLDLPGCDINLAQVVHGSQEIVLHRPLPTSGSGTVRTRISDVWDKGKAAIIVQEGEAADESGEPLFTTRSSIFVKGEGGWGGDRGPATKVELPARDPELTASYDVTPQQALLYRLCGDRNPLHVDPEFAEKAGFPAPILHGLCSYGIVLREVVQGLLDSDSARVGAFTARFAGVVFPGETIRVRAWDEGARIVVSATIASSHEQRDGAPVLADCVLTKA